MVAASLASQAGGRILRARANPPTRPSIKLDSTARSFGAILPPRHCAGIENLQIMKLRMTAELFSCIACVCAALVFVPPLSRAAATNDAPDFKEVYDLLRANLAGADEAGLNRAAGQG